MGGVHFLALKHHQRAPPPYPLTEKSTPPPLPPPPLRAGCIWVSQKRTHCSGYEVVWGGGRFWWNLRSRDHVGVLG